MPDTRSQTTRPEPGRKLAQLAGTGDTLIGCALATVSWGHIYELAIAAGEQPWAAALIASTVDTLIIVSFLMIGVARARRIPVPRVVRAALLAGVIATGTANIHHGVSENSGRGLGALVLGVGVALWAPLALELVYHCGRWLSATRPVQETAEATTFPTLTQETAPAVSLVPSAAETVRETTPEHTPKTTTKPRSPRKTTSEGAPLAKMQADREAAIAVYLERYEQDPETAPSERELADQFGYTKTWGRNTILKAKQRLEGAA